MRVVYSCSSARRDRGLLRLSECRAVLARAMPSVSNLVDRQMSHKRRRGSCTYSHYTSLCLKKYSVILQPPRLTATPPIFYVRKTHGEKRSPSAWLPSRGKNSCEARVEGCEISSYVGTQLYCVRKNTTEFYLGQKDKRISHTKKHVLMFLCLNKLSFCRVCGRNTIACPTCVLRTSFCLAIETTCMVIFSPHVFYARKI